MYLHKVLILGQVSLSKDYMSPVGIVVRYRGPLAGANINKLEIRKGGGSLEICLKKSNGELLMSQKQKF